MEFDAWLAKAWDEHADDAAGVAARIDAEGLALAQADPAVAALARLAHHVCGQHLGRWADGRALLARIGRAPAAGAATALALPVLDAALALAGGLGDERAALGASERIRVTALAASSLAEHDTPRAAALLRDALAQAEASALADSDPACRALAVTGNNLAATLEDKPTRSDAERELMILAARTGRTWWARAGGWLEIERAEYRLAHSWLEAGDPAQARRHALACLAVVDENDAPALERFFGNEALALAEAAAGDGAAAARAVAQARSAFDALIESDQSWCRASLDKLAP